LLGELTQSDELRSLPAFAPERLTTTARFFLDLIAVPMLLRALFEVNLRTLEAGRRARGARCWFALVVAAKLDRLFRSASDALSAVEAWKQHGVDLMLLDYGSDPVS
jgi:hypothetical protein